MSCKNDLKKFSKNVQYVLETSSRRLQYILQRCLQEVFNPYYQVKLFLVTRFHDVFKTPSKDFRDVLLRLLFTGSLPRSHFWEIYGQYTKFQTVVKVSQVLVFHFTTGFSGCLQRRI